MSKDTKENPRPVKGPVTRFDSMVIESLALGYLVRIPHREQFVEISRCDEHFAFSTLNEAMTFIRKRLIRAREES